MANTRGDEILKGVNAARGRLLELSYGAHERRDLCEVTDGVAARLEEFLRAAVFPMSSRRDTMNSLINDLDGLGIVVSERDKLHALRALYNSSKHDPAFDMNISDIRAVLDGVEVALNAVIGLGLPGVVAPPPRSLSYHLWVAAWDHYTGGETEVAIMLPSAHWTHVGAVDTIHLDWKSWDGVKLALSVHANFKWGESNFPPDAWMSFKNEGDFLNAGVWDGDYGALLRILARFNDTSKMDAVLPGLSRRNAAESVGAAVVTAGVDIARAAPSALDVAALEPLIAARAASEYAMPSDGPLAAEVVKQVSTLIAAHPFANWSRLAGPVLTTSVNVVSTVSGPMPMAVRDDLILLGVVAPTPSS